MKNFIFLFTIMMVLVSCEKNSTPGVSNSNDQITKRSSSEEPPRKDFQPIEYQQKILSDFMELSESMNSLGNAYCITKCNNEFNDCMWEVDQLYEPYLLCLQWVNECAESECPPAWCDNYQDSSDCDDEMQIYLDNLDLIATVTDKCYEELAECLYKCGKQVDPV
ncbi:MAG: hypothetical protein P1U56_20875 [Saprospiraceae bacterium]|nr:hypothetical protein [Saprospiraceae bacterium]